MRKFGLLALCILLAAGTAALAEDGSEEKANWFDKLEFGGDLRLRYEGFDWEDKLDNGKRNRFRFRFRAGMSAQIRDDLKVGFQIRSGNPDNPHSDNQTFDGGFNKKTLAISEAFVQWNATDRLTMTGGKFSPKGHKLWTVSDMQWDDDVIVEGALEGFTWKPGGSIKDVRINLYQFILDESSSSGDAYMFGGQIVPTFKLNDMNTLTAGIGYDSFSHPEKVVELSLGGNLDTEPEGFITNLVDPATGGLVSDFRVGNLFVIWKNKSSQNWPLTFSAFYYKNFGAKSAVGSVVENDDGTLVPVATADANDNDTAFYARLQVGDYAKPGQVAVRLIRYDSKPDAIFYAWVQSDTRRGSNLDGYRADVRVGMPAEAYINFTWYHTDWQIGEDTTMDRWQLDYIFKF